MTITRTPVPPAATLVVTDAGLETWLLFERGVELPAFVAIAGDTSAAVLLETPTWRANPDWGATLGVPDDGDPADLAERDVALRASLPSLHVVGGCCGTDHRQVTAIASAFTS